jgi:hypothetical protein
MRDEGTGGGDDQKHIQASPRRYTNIVAEPSTREEDRRFRNVDGTSTEVTLTTGETGQKHSRFRVTLVHQG